MKIQVVREFKKKSITKPEDVARILQDILKAEDRYDQDKEHFWVLGLNSRNVLQYLELVSLGSLNASLVHPREVFRLSVHKAVASIIIAHNHPSGETEPSREDLEITKRLTEAGKILGIDVLDHTIITRKDYLSFKEKNLI
ncbi:MAG: JAB domain-containing protein [Candidatus Ratteibacteria bacterium]|jgi:DNA repair protein RadC